VNVHQYYDRQEVTMYDNMLTLFTPWVPRYKVLRVSPELLLEGTLFNTRLSPDGTKIWATTFSPPLPQDVRVQTVCFDPTCHQVLLRLWSSEWPEVALGAPPPELHLTCTRKVYRLEGAVAKEQPPRGSLGVPATWAAGGYEKFREEFREALSAASVGFHQVEATLSPGPEEKSMESSPAVESEPDDQPPRGGYF
jgi:hypothetical protein